MTVHDESHRNGACRPGTKWVLWGFLAIAAFFLLAEHRAHVLGVLPYLLVLACPLMHVFMHRGHGDHDHHQSDGKDARK